MATPGPVSHVSSAPRGRTWGGLSLLLGAGPLTLWGEQLMRSTHHRPLAAVTFASGAVVLWLGIELMVRRGLGAQGFLAQLAQFGQGRALGGRVLLARACWVVGAVASAYCIFRALRG